MDDAVIEAALGQVSGVDIDKAALAAHEMSPAHLAGTSSDDGLQDFEVPLHLALGAVPMGPPALLHLDVNAFGAAVHATLKNAVSGYTMQLRQHGTTIYTLEWNWAKAPADGSEGWTPDVPMHVASVSKLITGIAMARLLIDKGKPYDTKIAPYLPAYWPKGAGIADITFRQLLTETSGLNYNSTTSDSRFPAMKAAVAAGTTHVGEYHYQNMNFGLCRLLIPVLNGNIAASANWPDTIWDGVTIQAYAAYVQQAVFGPAGVSGPTMDHPSPNALGYSFPVSGAGWDSGNLAAWIGGLGWHISCHQMLDIMSALRRKGTIMTTAQAQTMLDSGLGLDVVMWTPAGTLYNKNGLWTDGIRVEQALAYFLPEDMELVVLANSPIEQTGYFFRGVVTDAYLATLCPPEPAPRAFVTRADGPILHYTGTPGTWETLDTNPATIGIAAPDGGGLYQIHKTGRIWQYTGPPVTGWAQLDSNPASVQIAASAEHLYQRHNNGAIWQYAGTPMTGWEQLDNNPATISIAASGALLYQLHKTGKIWQYTGPPITGWIELDSNPATISIAASGGHLYQLHKTGKIWDYTGTPIGGWRELDNNPATVAIVAAGDALYQLHNTGAIWVYTGTPMTGWKQLDGNPSTKQIAASGPHLYQLHNTGIVWEYTGTPMTGWAQIGTIPNVGALSAGFLQ